MEKQRQEFQKVEQEVLAKLYQTQPSAKAAVASATGYAAFKNFGTKILFVGGGTGKGVAVSNKTEQRGGQTTAAASTGTQGGGFAGALSVSPRVWLFQITNVGLALEATAKGATYWKGSKLN